MSKYQRLLLLRISAFASLAALSLGAPGATHGKFIHPCMGKCNCLPVVQKRPCSVDFTSASIHIPALPFYSNFPPFTYTHTGVTDGEPGSNVEAHCCGMKGLGGAKVEVLCHPEQIAAGQPLYVLLLPPWSFLNLFQMLTLLTYHPSHT